MTGLDERLAGGADPVSNAALALRAWQLNHPGARRTIADTIERLLLHAQQPRTHKAVSAAVEPANEAVLASGRDLYLLAERLREARIADVRGVAMASLLLRDGCGPMYNATAVQSLEYCVRMATLCLEASTGDRAEQGRRPQ